jgi:hypothetical protein
LAREEETTMADQSPLDMNYILDEFAVVQKLPPALGGKRVDVLRKEAWERLAQKGVVEEITDTNFLGRAVSKGEKCHVYRTKSGLYEIWLEQRLGNKGDVDVIVWELNKDGDRVIQAKGTGMDSHSLGPSDPAATSKHIKH